MLEAREIIKKPLVTEKSTFLQDAFNQYVFLVHPQANRLQVKGAVEALFNVKVADVRTMVRKGKPRRAFGRPITTKPFKRAIVTLREGHKIDVV
ncbi:MAG: 50S ribosomal protein L23 [Planctomycetes bacterium]|nr:50S ribosomal protein L23 [Planctomycetota bacterium]